MQFVRYKHKFSIRSGQTSLENWNEKVKKNPDIHLYWMIESQFTKTTKTPVEAKEIINKNNEHEANPE